MRRFLIGLIGLLSISTIAFAQNIYLGDATTTEGQPAKPTVENRGTGKDPATVTFYTGTSTDTAAPGVDYVGTAQQFLIRPGQKQVIEVPTIDNDAPGPTKVASTRLIVNRGGSLKDGTGKITITDPDVAAPPPPPPPPTPVPCPAGSALSAAGHCEPIPAPAPQPVPVVSLTGLPPIASNFDTLAEMVPSWGSGAIPASASPDVLGAFRFICNAGQVLRDDPIVYPGQPGKSHLHQFYGNTSANASSTYASLRASGQSTCMSPLNRSAYWMPAMLSGGDVVRPDFVSIYYKRRPKSDPKCSLTSGDPQAEGNCVNLPNGLKFIFGYDMLTAQAPTGKVWFNCQGAGSKPGKYATIPEAAANCPAGAQLGAIIEAPDCWNGKDLDSANHRDHVAYSSYGTWGYLRCPATHPYVIPTFTLGAWFTSDANVRNWRLSSDDMLPNLPHGTTFHADFFMAWDPDAKEMWHGNCIDKKLNCSGGDFGNGKQMRQFSAFTWLASPRLVPIPD